MSAPQPAPRLERIGPYRIESRLGAGGMGEVYRAYDERLDRCVAIKLIRPEVAGHEKALERFRREARAAARLNHPAIVQIYDILQAEEGDAIVMEIVEGPTLAERLRGGPLDLGCALRVALRIAEGLAAAHADGIVHRDLKAENVVLTPAGDPKILDFGVAKRFRQSDAEPSLSIADAVVGTYRAMSPEQARAERVDHRSDLFSYGTLLYEMLTGRSPFPGEGVFDVLTKICTVRQTPVRELNPELPEPLSDLVDRLLEKDRAHRLQSAQEAVATLETIIRSLAPASEQLPSAAVSSLDDEPTLVDDPRKLRVEGPHLSEDKPSRRRPVAVLLRQWALLFGVLVLIVVLVTVLLSVLNGPDTDNRSAPSSSEESEPVREDAGEAPDVLPRDPIDPEIERLRAQLWQEPSEEALAELVNKEKELGEIDAARKDLKEFIVRGYNNSFALSLLAELELVYGNAEEAVKLYEDLVKRSPQFTELTNLGTAYLLLKRYERAEEKFREAQRHAPARASAALNLADAVSLQEREEEAEELYKKVLALTELSTDPNNLPFQRWTIRAQALAHLDRKQDAVEAVQKALAIGADNPQMSFEVSLVYAIMGEYNSALFNAGKALDGGFAPGWFKFPWFEPLKKNSPDFRELLKEHEGS